MKKIKILIIFPTKYTSLKEKTILSALKHMYFIVIKNITSILHDLKSIYSRKSTYNFIENSNKTTFSISSHFINLKELGKVHKK